MIRPTVPGTAPWATANAPWRGSSSTAVDSGASARAMRSFSAAISANPIGRSGMDRFSIASSEPRWSTAVTVMTPRALAICRIPRSFPGLKTRMAPPS